MLAAEPCTGDTIELDDVEVRTPAGDRLVDPVDVLLEPGDSLVITGRSGSGKTTLLRSLAQLWPYRSGTLRRPDGANETMFLSQLPYVPLGDLRAVVSYPARTRHIPDDELQRALAKVALGHLVIRLNEVQDWAKMLSPGEQQRVAFARILLTKPKAVFLDEATSALDEGLEFRCTSCCEPSCPTPSSSASATAPPSSSTTSSNWNCSAKARGGSAGWRATNRSPSNFGRRVARPG